MSGVQRSRRGSAAERIARLQEVTSALSESLTPDQVADVVVHQGIAALGARAGSIALLASDGATLEMLAAVGYSDAHVRPWRAFPVSADAPLAECARVGDLVLIGSRAERDERYPSLAAIATGDHAWAAVPLIVSGQVIGTLGLSFAETRAFDADERAFMLALARQCAQALDRARLYAAERSARAAAEAAHGRLAFLAEASKMLSSSLDYEAILADLARLVTPVLADWSVVDVAGDEGSLRRLAVAHADPSKRELVRQLLPFSPARNPDSPIVRALRARRPLLVEDDVDALVATVARDQAHQEIVRALAPGAILILPLITREHGLGALTLVVSASSWRYGPADIALAEELARRAAVALDNARLYAEARSAVRARDDLLSIVSHDLQNPLTVIKAQANLLARRLTRDQALDPAIVMAGLERVDAETDKMRRLIGELLDFAHMQVGRPLQLNLCAADLVALAGRVIAERQQSSEHHHIRLDHQAPALIGLWDPVRIERLLDNLLSNAIKYSPRGGEVTVEIARVEHESRPWAELAVRDQGIGIPAADLPRIFDRFYRASNVAGKIAGTGIGLASARQIAEQHGGSIAVTSDEQRGTVFIVRLPLDS